MVLFTCRLSKACKTSWEMTPSFSERCVSRAVGWRLRELIHDGQLEGFRRGKDFLVKTSSVLKLIASLPRARFTLPKQSKDIEA